MRRSSHYSGPGLTEYYRRGSIVWATVLVLEQMCQCSTEDVGENRIQIGHVEVEIGNEEVRVVGS